MKRTLSRKLTAIFTILAALSVTGCNYFHNRGADALDVIDLGFSFSAKPQFAFYYDFVPIIPIGYGDVDGYYSGLGGGKFSGWTPHRERSYGLLVWGQEEVSFNKNGEELAKLSEEERQKELLFQRTGLVGMGEGPFPGPEYLISCPHYIHLGWIGVVGTPRYLQMLDFLLGWTTLDICGDDKPAAEKSPEETAEKPTAE